MSRLCCVPGCMLIEGGLTEDLTAGECNGPAGADASLVVVLLLYNVTPSALFPVIVCTPRKGVCSPHQSFPVISSPKSLPLHLTSLYAGSLLIYLSSPSLCTIPCHFHDPVCSCVMLACASPVLRAWFPSCSFEYCSTSQIVT